MVYHDSQEQFYAKLAVVLNGDEVESKEFRDYVSQFETISDSGFYELCMKFADISLNSLKEVNPVTCDVRAVFQFADTEIAKTAIKEFIQCNHLNDLDGLLEVIHIMHQFAVGWDDPRCTGGRIVPKDYNWEPGFGGQYYNFSKLPEIIWSQISEEIRKDCSDKN